MVAPIITFVCAGIIGYLAWNLSTVESYLPTDSPEPVASGSSSFDEEEPAEEPADEPADEPAEESSEEADAE
jgi:hypothetical protein